MGVQLCHKPQKYKRKNHKNWQSAKVEAYMVYCTILYCVLCYAVLCCNVMCVVYHTACKVHLFSNPQKT